MADLQPGMLLVATPELADPNFRDTVVLLLDTGEDGALGVVLNRPSQILVADVLESWCDVVAVPEVLFRGGPVATDGALAVGTLSDPEDVPVGFREVFGRCGVVDLDTPVELFRGSLDGLRIFLGYAGWGGGQLEAEVDEGSWYVVPARPDDPFGQDVDTLRRDVLRRQPGALAWVATRPINPEHN